MLSVFKLLAGLRGLRGTPLDPFGYSHERKGERRLIRDYEALMTGILPKLESATEASAVALASLPDQIRGYGPVKAEAIAKAEKRKAELLAEMERRPVPVLPRRSAA